MSPVTSLPLHLIHWRCAAARSEALTRHPIVAFIPLLHPAAEPHIHHSLYRRITPAPPQSIPPFCFHQTTMKSPLTRLHSIAPPAPPAPPYLISTRPPASNQLVPTQSPLQSTHASLQGYLLYRKPLSQRPTNYSTTPFAGFPPGTRPTKATLIHPIHGPPPAALLCQSITPRTPESPTASMAFPQKSYSEKHPNSSPAPPHPQNPA